MILSVGVKNLGEKWNAIQKWIEIKRHTEPIVVTLHIVCSPEKRINYGTKELIV